MKSLSIEDINKVATIIERSVPSHAGAEYKNEMRVGVSEIISEMDLAAQDKAMIFLESEGGKTIFARMDASKSASESLADIKYILGNVVKVSDEAFDVLKGDEGAKYIARNLHLSSYISLTYFSPHMLQALKHKKFLALDEVAGEIKYVIPRLSDEKFMQLVDNLRHEKFFNFVSNISFSDARTMSYLDDEEFSQLLSVISNSKLKFSSGNNKLRILANMDLTAANEFIDDPKASEQWLKAKTGVSEELYHSTSNPFVVIEEYMVSSIFRAVGNGPWAAAGGDEARVNEIMDEVVSIPAFKTILDAVALTHFASKDNIAQFYRQPFFLTDYADGFAGYATHDQKVHMALYSSKEEVKKTTAHELGHSFASTVFHNRADPYTYNDSIGFNSFDRDVMHSSLANLHQVFLPGVAVPDNTGELLKTMDAYAVRSIARGYVAKPLRSVAGFISGLYSQADSSVLGHTKGLLGSFTQLIHHYEEFQYHREFFARLPESLAQFGSLPPHIMECFVPAIDDFKTRVTPAALKFIASHPYKGGIIPDSIKPETALARSGEDELMAKGLWSEEELKLVEHIKSFQTAAKNDDMTSFVKLLDDVKYAPSVDREMIVRAGLTAAIEHDRRKMFDAALGKIEAPQFLGPQLIKAAELDRSSMSERLLPPIKELYSLAKTAEIALARENNKLLQDAIQAIDEPWFLVSTAKRAIELNRTKEFVKAAEEAGKPQMNDLLLSELIKKKDFVEIDSMLKGKYLNFNHVCEAIASSHLENRRSIAGEYLSLPSGLSPMATTALSGGCLAYSTAKDPEVVALIIGTAVIGRLLWKAVKGIGNYLQPKPASYLEAVSKDGEQAAAQR